MPSNLSNMSCEYCGHTSFSTVFSASDFDTQTEQFKLERCNHCRLVRSSPVLSDAELGRYYSEDYYGSATKKFSGLIERWTQFTYSRRAKTILTLLRSRSETSNPISVLDIGCGRAHLLKTLAQSGCECVGIERSEFPQDDSKNIKIYHEDFLDVEFNTQKFDVIILWHVLEHLSSPSQTIKKISHLLNPSGVFLLAVPNFDSFQSHIFKKHWFHLDLPRHTFHFTDEALNQILKDHGLTTKKSNTWTLDQSVFGFIQSCLNASGLFPPNDFYHLLKHSTQTRFTVKAVIQFLLASLLLPISMVEFLVSGALNKGSCLNLQVVSKSD
ncbi:class I SAM-dependent methyltransferase [Kaarinaea lacus]